MKYLKIIGAASFILLVAYGAFLLGSRGRSTAKTPLRDAREADARQKVIWTCSMHPQIQEDEPGKCPLCGMDLIPAESAGDDASPRRLTMSPW